MSLLKLKDPDSTVDYTFDWGDGYLNLGVSPAESITTSTWVVSPATSPALSVSSDSKTATTATAFFTGGVRGTVYRATNRVVTSGGRTDDRSIAIRVGQR